MGHARINLDNICDIRSEHSGNNLRHPKGERDPWLGGDGGSPGDFDGYCIGTGDDARLCSFTFKHEEEIGEEWIKKKTVTSELMRLGLT